METAGVLEGKAARLACPCFSICFKPEEVAVAMASKRPLSLFESCTSLGGAASSLDHRAMWDSTRDVREFRLSIGLEDSRDLIADLERAFAVLRGSRV